MIDSTTQYKAAVVATTRRTRLRIVVDISDPDMVYTGVTATEQADVSVPGQLVDKEFDVARYATLERNRWLLDGSFHIFNDDYSTDGAEIGGVSEAMSGEDGTLSSPLYFELNFTNVTVLQVCAVWFSTDEADGYPVDFTVEIRQGGTAYHTQTFTDNKEGHVTLTGFTVYNPDAIRITVTKWSTPMRRVRIVEIVPGAYERWDDNKVTDASVSMNADPSCVTLPYGTCNLTIDNTDKMFEPRNKNGIFQSLQERQGIDVSIGLLVDGAYDYKGTGKFYQYNGGWKTSDNGTTLRWDLVDIVGLLSDREFIPPEILPTTTEGWMQAILSTLGSNFSNRYTIDPTFAQTSLTATREAVTGIKCGDMIRYVCMAVGAWPRADAETGNLAIEPLWEQGNRLDLDNMTTYPTIKANDDVAQMIFTLNDEEGTQYVVGGNSMSASKSVSVSNPFIATSAQALEAAKSIVTHFGGNVYQTAGRSNPATEIGDVVTIELDESNATTGRVLSQSFSYSRQVLTGETTLVQASGKLTYTDREEIKEDGQWSVPSGVTQLRIILVGGGDGGGKGTDGSWSSTGEDGADGSGGSVWWGLVNVTPGTTFAVTIGQGGASNGGQGTATHFGQYTSAAGYVYTPSYTDITEGNAYGRTGVQAPLANTGDGGKGGVGGVQGIEREKSWKDDHGFVHSKTVIDQRPGPGGNGAAGASGCVAIYYDKP